VTVAGGAWSWGIAGGLTRRSPEKALVAATVLLTPGDLVPVELVVTLGVGVELLAVGPTPEGGVPVPPEVLPDSENGLAENEPIAGPAVGPMEPPASMAAFCSRRIWPFASRRLAALSPRLLAPTANSDGLVNPMAALTPRAASVPMAPAA
jgi:hypothetical protein